MEQKYMTRLGPVLASFSIPSEPTDGFCGTAFNQILEAVSGEYFSLICDDDEVSSNYISTLAQQLADHPEASVGFARQEIINEEGVVIRRSKDFPAQVLPGMEFIRGLWKSFAFGFEAVGKPVARTAKILERGGYPDFAHGNGIDNALVIKLCLDNKVALNPGCIWRWRVQTIRLWMGSQPERIGLGAHRVHAVSGPRSGDPPLWPRIARANGGN